MKNNRKLIALLCVLAIVFTTVFGCLTTLTAAENIPVVQYNTFDDPSTISGFVAGTGFAVEADDEGNNVLKFDLQSSNWDSAVVKFSNITLKKGAKYNISFEGSVTGPIRAQLFVGKGDNANALNSEVYLTADGSYKKYEYAVTVPDTMTGEDYSLAIRIKKDPGTVKCAFDDFIVTEVKDGVTTGNVLVDNGEGLELVPDISSYDVIVPEVDPEGYVFKGWFTNRGTSDSFSGTVPANTTVMLYKKYSVAVQSEDFETDGESKFFKAAYPVEFKEEDGNHFVKFIPTKTYELAVFHMNDIIVEPDTEYTLTFKYRKFDSNTINHGMRIGAYRNTGDWQFWFNKKTESMNELNLYDAETTNADGHRSSGFQLEKTAEWKTFTVELSSGEVANSVCKYLGFMIQTPDKNSCEIDIDDIVLTTQKPEPATAWYQTFLGKPDKNMGGYSYFNIAKYNDNDAVEVDLPANTSGCFPVGGLRLDDNTSYTLTFETLGFNNDFQLKAMAGNSVDLNTVTTIAKANGKQTLSFTTGTDVKGTTLNLYTEAGVNAVKGYIDDVILTKIVEGKTTGTVIVNDSENIIFKSAVNAYSAKAPKYAPANAAFCGWYTDRSFTNSYSGVIAANETVMLYPKFTTEIDLVQVEDFEGNNPADIASGFASFASIGESAGNHFFHYNETRSEAYTNGTIYFNYLHLKADTSYELKFKYKSAGSFNFDIKAENTSLNAGVSALSGTEGKYVEAKYVLNTDSTCAFGARLAFYLGVGWQTSDAEFDDITLTEVCPETGFGIINVHKNNGSADEVVAGKIGEVAEIKAPVAPSRKLFEGWYTNSGLTTPFDGKYPNGTIDIYANYVDKNMDDQIEDFQVDGENIKIIGDTATGTFEIRTDAKGNKYYYMNDKKKSGEYPQFGCRFNNIELLPNTTYMVSFDYQYEGPAKFLHGMYMMAGSNRSDWDFYMTKWTNGAAEKNLLGTATDQKTGYRTTSVPSLTNTGTGSWSSYSVTFNTGSIVDDTYKYLTFWLQGVDNAATTLAFDNVRLSALTSQDQKDIIKNADFKRGELFWSDASNIGTIEKEGSTNILHIKDGQMAVFQQMITLPKNTNYKITFKYKGKFSGIPNWAISKNSPNTAATNALYKDTFEDSTSWKSFSKVITTENQIFISNQSFKDASDFYGKLVGKTIAVVKGSVGATYAASIKGKYEFNIAEYANTDAMYEAVAAGSAFAGLDDKSIVSNYIKTNTECGFATVAGTEQYSTSDTDSLFFLFQSNVGCDYYIKEIKIAKAFSAVEPIEVGSTPLLNSGYKYSVYDGTEWCYAYISSEQDNVVKDYSFENKEGANWKSVLTASNGKITLDTTGKNSLTGNNALKYSCYDGTANEKTAMYFNVKRNTIYYMTLFLKVEERPSADKINCLNVCFVDPNTGLELSYYADYNSYDTRTVPTDGTYHMLRMAFESGTNDNIGLAFFGETTAYIDDIYIYESGNAIPYKFSKRDIESASLKPTSALLGCADEDNLIENRNCSKANNFWTSVSGYNADKYNKSVTLEDSYSSRGMALHYVANTFRTGYPKGNYFLKWLDVEPNTDYTLSCDYCAVVPGDGSIGIIDSNGFYPHVIGSISFNSETAQDGMWNTEGFSFNTGGYDKIGFYICDRGGEAWVDNIRVFKTADATEIENGDNTNIPTEITSSSLTVDSVNHVLYGVKDGMTVQQIVDKLDNNEYIRVYKNGEVVTDYSQPFTYDMEVALVDGPAINDKVTLYLWGDANHDRKFDALDPELLLKVLVKKNNLDQYGILAGDVSIKSEGITITEVVAMYETINGIGAE